MKTIQTDAVITGIRAKVDRSLGLSLSTPELDATQKAYFMELQGINVKLTIEPLEEQAEKIEIDTDMNQKSQSQRMRSVLYILYKQDNEGFIDFPSYYHAKMEKLIDFLKGKIIE